VLVLTHDNPDPDSIASAVALAFLLEKRTAVEARVVYGGIIGRSENLALVKVLRLPISPVSQVVFDEHDLPRARGYPAARWGTTRCPRSTRWRWCWTITRSGTRA
jgi:hypothetical protein